METSALLKKLAKNSDDLCVTISLNTHRTHPDSQKDSITLKNFVSEAKERILAKHEKREVANILDQLDLVQDKIDVRENLKSLHVFISENTSEIFRSDWATNQEGVHVSRSFAVRPLVKQLSRKVRYRIMVLSQSGVSLYDAQNGAILKEVKDHGFPFGENRFYNTFPDRSSDAGHLDDLLREFLNRIDKALNSVYNSSEKVPTVVICVEDNYSHLLQVADNPSIYWGYSAIDYNNVAEHQIVGQAWDFVNEQLDNQDEKVVSELREAVGQGKVITDLQEIYQASVDGRGELLVIQEDFIQPASLDGNRGLNLEDSGEGVGVFDDITSVIAFEVLEKGGECYFAKSIDDTDLSPIALKVRY
ncbi:baeRF3 domain-containing protein [Sphingobacterium psychroaquaticum]|uniref:Uncharacterized protein n=1 Tax=Sphingobacterium psychroaquaticum TaxID=561061 RepID=A0A1X7HUR6_9SPHI|nr:hypothetical protein [Sphingobacterium psychroaquaticum]SMG05732.1 hypothetical protein SAMN05660862_0067 [Sphingobacterium psychroaquaticum]